MRNISRKSYFRLLSFIIIITTSFLPIVAINLPPILGSYRFVWAPLWLLSIILFYPKVLLNKQIVFLLFYGIIFIQILLVTLWSGIRDWDKEMVREEFYVFIVSITIIWYFRLQKDYKGLALLSKWAIIFSGITAIMTIITSIIDPMYARNLIGGAYDSARTVYITGFGGGNYGFAGALIALFPIMVYYYRNNKLSIFPKTFILIFGIICFIALIRMQIFANIILAAITICISLLGSKNIKKSLVFIGILILLILFIPTTFYSNLLLSISAYFNPHSEVYFKLKDMAKFIVLGNMEGTEAGGRAARYPLLMHAFLANPLFGYYVTNHSIDIGAGGHLYWMNKLTIFGFFGFIPYLLIHYFFIKNNLKYFDKQYSFYYLISVFSIISLGLLKNLAGREMWFVYFVLLPGLYYLPYLKYKNPHSKAITRKSHMQFNISADYINKYNN
jgi:hypothetical protein